MAQIIQVKSLMEQYSVYIVDERGKSALAHWAVLVGNRNNIWNGDREIIYKLWVFFFGKREEGKELAKSEKRGLAPRWDSLAFFRCSISPVCSSVILLEILAYFDPASTELTKKSSGVSKNVFTCFLPPLLTVSNEIRPVRCSVQICCGSLRNWTNSLSRP